MYSSELCIVMAPNPVPVCIRVAAFYTWFQLLKELHQGVRRAITAGHRIDQLRTRQSFALHGQASLDMSLRGKRMLVAYPACDDAERNFRLR